MLFAEAKMDLRKIYRVIAMAVGSGIVLLFVHYADTFFVFTDVAKPGKSVTSSNVYYKKEATRTGPRRADNGNHISAYTQQLLKQIRSYVTPPSRTLPRWLARRRSGHASQAGQSQFVDKLLSRRRNGFFIECGAANGVSLSNTLFFELERNWTGLLIDANPLFQRSLLKIHRRAYVLPACLSTERRPTTVRFRLASVLSGIADTKHQSRTYFMNNLTITTIGVKCFPLNAVLEAINVSHVDFFSLDVEGPELEILQTIDWNYLRIDVISVEYRINTEEWTLRKLEALRRFFRDTGLYREVGLLPNVTDEVLGLDVIFQRLT